MKQAILFIAVLGFCSCNKTIQSDLSNNYIAKVGNHILTEEEYKSKLPDNLNASDSLIIAENIITTWIKEYLLYDLAVSNMNNKEEVDQLVESYKHSLITYQYQERLINEKMSNDISEQEIEKFYNENSDKFRLETSLIKGLFLKVPKDAPEINKIKEWYKSASIKEIEKIEKYSLQNAVNYDYFYDRWVRLDEVMVLFPSDGEDHSSSLNSKKQIEVQDSTFYYLLNVKEMLRPGETEPLESARKNIREMIMNQKRLDFLRNFETDLYQVAVERGMVKRK